MDKRWESFLEYIDELGVMPRHVAEFIAVFPILQECALGYATVDIARRVGCDIDYVKEVLSEFFGFEGWEATLDFSPIALYNNAYGDIEDYEEGVRMESNIPKAGIAMSYNVCKAYLKVKKEIESYYEKD
jgi:hypothetical protein